jgi:alanine dehydrogenase
MPTLILDKKTVSALLDMKTTIKAVEQAFCDWTEGKGTMPSKSYLSLEKGDFRAMPAALPGAAGVKWVNVHPQNPSRGLPTVMAVLIYSDPDTGYPLAIMDATDITAFRTGATAAIAARNLARPDSHILGIIGAGRQSYTQITAHAELFNIDLVRVYDVNPAPVERLIEHFPQFKIVRSPIEEVAASDIVCTLTPARKPVLKKAWLRPGTHINAIGADAAGKEELEPAVLKAAMVVVDDLKQAASSGEINVPISQGLYSPGEIYSTLGEVIAGKKAGRKDPQAITVFDSTGVAIEDIAIAKLVYEAAKGGARMGVELV